ncbi:MAG: beta-galactosidase, partial [Polyangiales bacterium]
QARSPRQNPVILGFPPQMFPVPSYASDAFMQETERWYAAVGEVIAPALYPSGPVVLLQVDNEAAYYFRNGPYDQDYHPDALRQWSVFLLERYRSLTALNEAYGTSYARFEQVQAPRHFTGQGPRDLVIHLDWAAFQEALLGRAIARMRVAMEEAGMHSVPMVHNVPLGDGGLPLNVPALSEVVDVVGFDYYHPAREYKVIKRRTLYLAGTTDYAFAPELGIGAPPWFTPLSNRDSLFCAQTACAFGLRGFNLYMAVDRDRWYGAPIDAQGNPRVEAGLWKQWLTALQEHGFHQLERRVEVALMVPREYARLSRATHLLGPISPSTLEAIGGTPVDACREDDLGFPGPIQVLWWRMLDKIASALSEASIPYVFIDSAADLSRYAGIRLVFTPTFEFVDVERWQQLVQLGGRGVQIVYGPAQPTLDGSMRRRPFEMPQGARQVQLDTPADARALVRGLQSSLGLDPGFCCEPRFVEVAVHEDAQGPRLLFVINPSDRLVKTELRVPTPMWMRDVFSHEPFVAEQDRRCLLPMSAHSCRMLVVEALEQEGKMHADGGSSGPQSVG